MDKVTTEFISDCCRDAAAAKEVGDYHSGVATCADDALEEGFWFLGGVILPFLSHVEDAGDAPYIGAGDDAPIS